MPVFAIWTAKTCKNAALFALVSTVPRGEDDVLFFYNSFGSSFGFIEGKKFDVALDAVSGEFPQDFHGAKRSYRFFHGAKMERTDGKCCDALCI